MTWSISSVLLILSCIVSPEQLQWHKMLVIVCLHRFLLIILLGGGSDICLHTFGRDLLTFWYIYSTHKEDNVNLYNKSHYCAKDVVTVYMLLYCTGLYSAQYNNRSRFENYHTVESAPLWLHWTALQCTRISIFPCYSACTKITSYHNGYS